MEENAAAVCVERFERLPGNPVAGSGGLEFGEAVDGQRGVAHAGDLFDELIDEIGGAGGEGELDVR